MYLFICDSYQQEPRENIEEEQRFFKKTMREASYIVMVPFPAHGHVTPMLHLARAIRSHGFTPMVAVPDFIHRQFAGRNDEVLFKSIPSGLKEDETKDFLAVERSMEGFMPSHFERLLENLELDGVVACVLVDLLASWAIGVAARCSIPVAGFWPAMLATYQLISAIPELVDKGLISQYGIPIHCQGNYEPEHNEQLLLLPSKKAKLSTKDLPWLVGNPAAQKSRFAFWLRVLHRTTSLPWILINSFPGESGDSDDFPPLSSTSLQSNHIRIFQVGPLLATDIINNGNDDDKSCMQWLEKQNRDSVIYVSFGTWVGPIAPENITELAHGLEATNRPFLWVLKDEESWRAGLPKEYLSRITGKGMVVPWAPQEQVLQHQAVGCYLTHCGWNSTVEAVRHEKRLLCFPIAGDQFVNCAYITSVWMIGRKLDGLQRDAVRDAIEKMMTGREGEVMQKRVSALKVRVMGHEAKSRAARNLQSFVRAVREAKHG